MLNVIILIIFFYFNFFSGREWAAASTEGLLIYSLDQNLVFDPFELEMDITPVSIRATLAAGEHSRALMLAFRLNEQNLIQEVLELTPVTDGEAKHSFIAYCFSIICSV